MEPRRYGPFPYSAITDRPVWRWPNGARIAVWVIPNIEFFPLDVPVPGEGSKVPNVPAWAMRDYGNRVGVFRMMEAMERYKVRGTVALNADVCIEHPNIIAAAKSLGWEFMGHNETNSKALNEIPADQEPVVIANTLGVIERATGARPQGWLGSGLQETWQTLDLLHDGGVRYIADWVNDDQPYRMTLGDRTMFSIPYTLELNDRRVFGRQNKPPEEFEAMIRRQFDVLYRESATSPRVMAIALHPYLVGVAHRIGPFESALAYIAGHKEVWFATGAEIVAAYDEATRRGAG